MLLAIGYSALQQSTSPHNPDYSSCLTVTSEMSGELETDSEIFRTKLEYFALPAGTKDRETKSSWVYGKFAHRHRALWHRKRVDDSLGVSHALETLRCTWCLTCSLTLLYKGLHGKPPFTSASFSRVHKVSGPSSCSSSVSSKVSSSPSGASRTCNWHRPCFFKWGYLQSRQGDSTGGTVQQSWRGADQLPFYASASVQQDWGNSSACPKHRPVAPVCCNPHFPCFKRLKFFILFDFILVSHIEESSRAEYSGCSNSCNLRQLTGKAVQDCKKAC